MKYSQMMRGGITLVLGLSVLFVSPVQAAFPNDPEVYQLSYEMTQTYRAWEYTTGSPEVVVAIIDNGFDETHPDLVDALWVNTDEIPGNGLDDDNNGYTDDRHGWNFVKKEMANVTSDNENDLSVYAIKNHATVVAGIIGATGNNGRDGVGIAHGVKLMNLQVITADGIGAVDPLVEAIYYAVDNGADIINISMVGRGIVDEIRSAVYYAYQKGVVVVGAGGNDMEDLNIIPQFPICADAYDPFSAIIGVSAVGEDRRLASFSNIGASCIDITAPGVNIAGPIRGGLSNLEGKTYVRGWNGTSFATPFISAAAALIKSIQPSWGVDQIVRTIQSTVRHTPSEDEVAYREIYGKGLLQIGSAVESAAMGVMLGPRTFVEGDYDTLFTSPRRLIIASEGGVKYGDIVQGRKVEVGAPFLPGAYAIAGVRDAIGNPYIVTLQKKTETESVVIVRTWSGFERGRWSIEAGDHQLLGADMSDTPGTEIVVLNKKTGKITIFSLEGVREGEVRGMGGSLKRVATTESIPETGRDALIYADELAGSIVVSRLTGMASSSEKIFETTVHKSLGSITEFTRDTDGESVIAMGTSIGASPVVTLFDMDGVLIHSFRPYDLSFRGGVSVDTIVHGMKGSEHLVVVPERGVQPMRVFDWAGSRVLDRSIDTIVAPNRRVLSTVVPF